MADKIDLMILGRIIGTYDAWDGGEDEQYTFYSYEPNEQMKKNYLFANLPCPDLSVDFRRGLFLWYDDDGRVLRAIDMIKELECIEAVSSETRLQMVPI